MRYQVRGMRHVMKIGPMDLEKGSASAYVAFGESGLDVVLEATDNKGLAALRRTSSRGVGLTFTRPLVEADPGRIDE